MKFKADPIYKPSNFQMDVWQVEKLVKLPTPEFDALVTIPCEAHPVIAENKKYMFSDGGTIHALLVLGEGRRDGVLVESEGYDNVRYGAFLNGARDIVNAELERAADFIIRRCAENPGGGSWQACFNGRTKCGGCTVRFEELESQLGLTIRDGNGLDAMLLDTLRRRPEISTVELDGGCISAVCDLSPRRDSTAAPRKKASVTLTTKRKADLFDNAVSTVCEIFDGEDLYGMLHDSFGLTLQEIRARGYMTDQEIAATCGVPEEMLDCDITVRDVLGLDGVPGSVRLSCDGSDYQAPLDGLKALTDNVQGDFTALLDAQVADIRVDEEAPDLILQGVEAAELERLHDILEAQGQTMGPRWDRGRRLMEKFDTRRVAEGLTTYAIERRHSWERQQREGAPTWMEQRRFWTDAILQGMARLDGGQPDPTLMERFDRELEQDRGCYLFTPATRQMQKDTIRELRRFTSALEDTGDDRRRQVDVVWRLLEDMSSHLPWASQNNDLSLACGEAESALRRMTAQMPIRFTRILLGGDAGPHWASGFAPGAVTDAGAVKRTAVYQEAVRDYPDVKNWPALCTVYVGRNLSSAWGTADACDFDLEIMNRAGDRFLKEPGVRWASGPCQMTISVEQAVAVPEMSAQSLNESAPFQTGPAM